MSPSSSSSESVEPVPVCIPAQLVQRLEAMGHEHGCDLFHTLFACWALLLCHESGQEEMVLGSMYHGRDAIGNINYKIITYKQNNMQHFVELCVICVTNHT